MRVRPPHPLDVAAVGEDVVRRLGAMGCLPDVLKLGLADREGERREVVRAAKRKRGPR